MSVINTPQIIETGDYHDFEYIQEDYRKLVPGIKVKEIGHDPETGQYVGIVYLGNLKNLRTKKMFQGEKKRLAQIEKNFDYNLCLPIR